MDKKQVAIGGIDRHTGVQDCAPGVCEELINIRPEKGGLRIYRDATPISTLLDFTGIFLHRWLGNLYPIGIRNNNVVWFDKDTAEVIQEICTITAEENVCIKCLNNTLIISDKGVPCLFTYVLESKSGTTTYKLLYDGEVPLPVMTRDDIELSPFSSLSDEWNANINQVGGGKENDSTYYGDYESKYRYVLPFFFYLDDDVSPSEEFTQALKDSLRAQMSRVSSGISKYLAHGYVMVGTSLTLYDGTETAFSNFRIVDLSFATPYRDEDDLPDSWVIDTHDYKNTIQWKVNPQKNSLDGYFFQFYRYLEDIKKIYIGLQVHGGDVSGRNAGGELFHTLTLHVNLPDGIEKYKDYIRGVSVWVSKPFDKIDWDNFSWKIYKADGSEQILSDEDHDTVAKMFCSQEHNNTYMQFFAPVRHLSQCSDELQKQLLFRQKEWTIDEILTNGSTIEHRCEFGSDEGTTGDTLSVDNWNTRRSGNMYVYNNKVHLWDAVNRVVIDNSQLDSLNGYDNTFYSKDDETTTSSTTKYYWHVRYRKSATGNLIEGSRAVWGSATRWTGSRAVYQVGIAKTDSTMPPTTMGEYDWYKYYGRTGACNAYYFKKVGTSSKIVISFSNDGQQSLNNNLTPYSATEMGVSTNTKYVNKPKRYDWGYCGFTAGTGHREYATRDCTVIAYLTGDNGDIILRHEDVPILFGYDSYTTSTDSDGDTVKTPVLNTTAQLCGFMTYPDARCYRIVMQYTGDDNLTYGWSCDMNSFDSAYNYAYAYITEGTALFTSGAKNTDVDSSTYNETTTVVVSALNNPTYFPVANSYRVQGNVTGVATAYEQITPTQVGQYPLYILTDAGTWALEMGTGDVLYSNLVPVNGDATESGKYTATSNGLVYIANGRLYMLQGRGRLDIMQPLEGAPDTAPRENNSYPLAVYSDKLYNIKTYLSNDNISEYIEDAVLCYDAYHNELLLSSPSHTYTYVFNFDAFRWYKITGTFYGTDNRILFRHAVGDVVVPAGCATGRITITNLLTTDAEEWTYHLTFDLEDAYIPANAICESGDTLYLELGGGLYSYSVTASNDLSLEQALSVLLAGDGSWRSMDYRFTAETLYYAITSESNEMRRYVKCTIYGQNQAASSRLLLGEKGCLRVTNSRGVVQREFDFSMPQITDEDWTPQTVTIPGTGYGDIVSVTIGGVKCDDVKIEKSTSSLSDSVTLAGAIAMAINNSDAPVVATVTADAVYGNAPAVFLTAKEGGASGNDIAVDCYALLGDGSGEFSPNVSFVVLPMNFGYDATTKTEDIKTLVSLYDEQESEDRIIHIQTRPIKLTPLEFGKVYRSIWQLKARLTEAQNLSVYIFASTNLKDYKCICAEQRTSCIIDRIRTGIVARHYRYFVLMLGGRVSTDTEIGTLVAEVGSIANAKLR